MQIKLPKWLPIKDIKKLITILATNGDSRLVGGCVREILVGNQTDDIDIATQVESHTALKLLSDADIKCIPTGIKHGTITAFLHDKKFEITTLRKDIENYGRHAKVEFTDNWQEDAKRRDFTVNAMYLDLSGHLYDYFNGYNDLQNKLIKFVGAPFDRIHEDYLRILRYFRFYSYFGGNNLDNNSLQACMQLAENIKKLSGERVYQEIFKILKAKFVNQALELMKNHGIWQQIFGFNLPSRIKNLVFTNDPLVNLAAIIKCAKVKEKEFRNIAKRLRFSNKEIGSLTLLCYTIKFPLKEVEKILYYYGPLNSKRYLEMQTMLGIRITSDILKKIQNWHVPKFPITGYDLQPLGFTGKDIGKMLKSLEDKWVDSKFSLTKNELLNAASKKNK